MTEVRWGNVAEYLKSTFRARGNVLLEGALEDMDNFAAIISTDITEALRLGRQDLVNECIGQFEALGEKHRIRAADTAWQSFKDMAFDLAGFAITFIGAVV